MMVVQVAATHLGEEHPLVIEWRQQGRPGDKWWRNFRERHPDLRMRFFSCPSRA